MVPPLTCLATDSSSTCRTHREIGTCGTSYHFSILTRRTCQAVVVWLHVATSYVYFITGAGLTKVGVTTNPRQRLASLQRRCPVTLTLLYWTAGDMSLERELHQALKDDGRHVFREWFTAMSADVAKSYVGRALARRRDVENSSHLRERALACLQEAEKAENGSNRRRRLLDEATAYARRLQKARVPKPAVEAIFAEVAALRLGWEPREVELVVDQQTAPVAYVFEEEPEPWLRGHDLLDL